MSDTKHNEYLIQSLEDFYKIPEEKVEACLKDFAVWLELGRSINLFQDLIGIKCIEREGFIWIDDEKTGIRDIRVSVRVAE